jgi:CO/xanthine dehydrogenase Mo-binding subunit
MLDIAFEGSSSTTPVHEGRGSHAILRGRLSTRRRQLWRSAWPYEVGAVRATTRAIYTNGPICGAFRGFGVPQAAVAHEALVDDVAAQLGTDRLEIRLRNALRAGSTTATGQRLEASAGLVPCLEALRPRWDEAVAEADRVNPEALSAGSPVRRGVGIGAMWYGIGNTSLPNPSTIRSGFDATVGTRFIAVHRTSAKAPRRS